MDVTSPDLIELASKIAVGLIGWREVRPSGTTLIGIPPLGAVEPGEFLADDVAEVPLYPGSDDAVRPVVNLMKVRGWLVSTRSVPGGAVGATLTRYEGGRQIQFRGFGSTGPIAICRAACRAQGIEP